MAPRCLLRDSALPRRVHEASHENLDEILHKLKDSNCDPLHMLQTLWPLFQHALGKERLAELVEPFACVAVGVIKRSLAAVNAETGVISEATCIVHISNSAIVHSGPGNVSDLLHDEMSSTVLASAASLRKAKPSRQKDALEALTHKLLEEAGSKEAVTTDICRWGCKHATAVLKRSGTFEKSFDSLHIRLTLQVVNHIHALSTCWSGGEQTDWLAVIRAMSRMYCQSGHRPKDFVQSIWASVDIVLQGNYTDSEQTKELLHKLRQRQQRACRYLEQQTGPATPPQSDASHVPVGMSIQECQISLSEWKELSQRLFRRYDLDGSDTISGRDEFEQLTTNLAAKLSSQYGILAPDMKKFDELVACHYRSMTLEQYQDWYLGNLWTGPRPT